MSASALHIGPMTDFDRSSYYVSNDSIYYIATSNVSMQYPSFDSRNVFVENSLMNFRCASSSDTRDLSVTNIKIISS